MLDIFPKRKCDLNYSNGEFSNIKFISKPCQSFFVEAEFKTENIHHLKFCLLEAMRSSVTLDTREEC